MSSVIEFDCVLLYLKTESTYVTECTKSWANITLFFRLLYTLAFKPTFVRGLWVWVSGMSQLSSFGGPATPLLGALSRGLGADAYSLNMQRLLAPLAVFCALFSLLIGTLHDTEFFRDPNDEANISSKF